MNCLGDECARVHVYSGQCLPCFQGHIRLFAGPCHACQEVKRSYLDGVPPFDLHVKNIAGSFHWHDGNGIQTMLRSLRSEVSA